ncbi:THAP domain-containing protein 1-like [Achroia grisella]|uniref:THAP domain-containing protein 1-like n=1 Tax=Achroia grisella TaxID=688607 RepID=UPI0027D2FBF6|nr:THAP domain-containing protein 1-like [Achroia grisella]
MSNTHCAVTNCKTTSYNKLPGVSFHSCPSSKEMRSKWLQCLKNKCSILDWSKSKICSVHFEKKYFDAQRKLKENAVPSIFPIGANVRGSKIDLPVQKTKVDRLLNRVGQAEISADIKNTLTKMRVPTNLDMFVADDLKCKPDSPMEAHLWLLIKKQDYLNKILATQLIQNKKQVEILHKNLDDIRNHKNDTEQNISTLKYIVKCLQEKHATLEEQIEILSAVESR